MIQELNIFGGRNKAGDLEPLRELTIQAGEIIGIVGPTGSGKSSLIADIEQLAQEDTPTKRKILVNGIVPHQELRNSTRKKIVAQLSQNMHFFANMSVFEFIHLHAKCRDIHESEISRVIELANTLTGEPVRPEDELSMLSGGQSRALMVADISLISDSPIVLIDEIENAGIKKYEALQVLAGNGKIVLVVTHDPVLALLASRRIIMKNGGMIGLVDTNDLEQKVVSRLNEIDRWMLSLREQVRKGERIEELALVSSGI
jgi:ABC-type lipoprotein export system ATPase subunit